MSNSSLNGMFVINLRPGAFSPDSLLSAKASTIDKSLRFTRAFTIDGLLLLSEWILDHDGRYVMEAWDWYDGWSADPIPPLARIIAPQGFGPPLLGTS